MAMHQIFFTFPTTLLFLTERKKERKKERMKERKNERKKERKKSRTEVEIKYQVNQYYRNIIGKL